MKMKQDSRGGQDDRLSWFLGLVLVLVLTLVACGHLALWNQTHTGHHWWFNNFRISAMAAAWEQGRSGRWIESFAYGWGYPLFVYTAPLPYWAGAALKLLGFSTTAALNLLWYSCFFLAALTGYWVGARIYGGLSAILMTVCLLYGPYHFVDVLVRTNLGESLVFVWLPLLLYAFWMCQDCKFKGVLIGSSALMLIILTHLLSTLLVAVGFGVYALTNLLFLKNKSRGGFILSLVLMTIFGLGISAFFWLPALLDLHLVRGASNLTENYLDYKQHFVYLPQLFSHFWGYGGSIAGEGDSMSLSLGLGVVGLASLAVVLIAGLKLGELAGVVSLNDCDRKVIALVFSSFVSFLVTAWLATDLSSGIWKEFPLLPLMQFPWRFHLSSTFFLAVCAGGVPYLAGKVGFPSCLRLVTTILAGGLIIWLHWGFRLANGYSTIPSADDDPAIIRSKGVTTTLSGEFFPAGVKTLPQGTDIVTQPFFFVSGEEEKAVLDERIKSFALENGWALAELRPGSAGKLVLRQFWYPAWHALVDNRPAASSPYLDSSLAPVSVDVPAQAQQVTFVFMDTENGRIGSLMSITTAILGALAITYAALKAKRSASGGG